MKKAFLAVIVMSLITLAACSSTPESSNTISSAKKISLEDAPSILDLSLLLPSRFEQVDAASEGMSNEDMGLGSDCSEVQLYMSEDPFQVLYGFMGIVKSRIEGAVFDRQLEDEAQMKTLIEESILEGIKSEGIEATVPNLNISHPDIGDSAILGEGSIESYGYYFSFDVLFFRSGNVYVFLYSFSMISDRVSLVPIGEEIEQRIGEFSQ